MEVTEAIFKDMKKRFDAGIQEINQRTNINTKMLTKEFYLQAVAQVKACDRNPHVLGFDVISLDGVDKLIVSKSQDNPKIYVHMEEMFQIIYDTHLVHGHCGRNRMEKEINSKYKNITREMLRLFLSICFICEQKRPVAPKTDPVKPQRSNNFETRFPRCQVNVMEMEGNQDGPYKYILVYEDHLTKFVQLRPLKTSSTKEIAGSLLKIFTIFGAPTIMHSENGREFASTIIQELAIQWNQIKMVHGESQTSSLSKDILELIEMWMEKNRMSKWWKCLQFVQLMKNKCRHNAIDCTPFEAMFGSQCKIGLNSDDVPKKTMAEIETEEDLNLFVKGDRVLKVKVEAVNDNNCDEGSVDYFENYLKSLKQEIVSEEDDENNASHTMPPSKIIKLSNY